MTATPILAQSDSTLGGDLELHFTAKAKEDDLTQGKDNDEEEKDVEDIKSCA